MPESALRKSIRSIIEDFTSDILEERAVSFIIRELRQGRSLGSILEDPYIKNRLDEDKVARVLENEALIKAIESEISQAFEKSDFKFNE